MTFNTTNSSFIISLLIFNYLNHFNFKYPPKSTENEKSSIKIDWKW